MTYSLAFVAGLFFGGLNFWLLTRVVVGMALAGEIPKWKTGLFFFGKMTLLFVILGLILWKGYVTPLPFLGGFTVSLVAGIAIMIWRGKEKSHA